VPTLGVIFADAQHVSTVTLFATLTLGLDLNDCQELAD